MALSFVPTTDTWASRRGSFVAVSVTTPHTTPFPAGGGRDGLGSSSPAAPSAAGASAGVTAPSGGGAAAPGSPWARAVAPQQSGATSAATTPEMLLRIMHLSLHAPSSGAPVDPMAGRT